MDLENNIFVTNLLYKFVKHFLGDVAYNMFKASNITYLYM